MLSAARLLLLPALAGLLLAAAPGDGLRLEPLREAIISDARAANPAGMAFERSTTAVRRGPGINEKTVTVERWDGQRWTLQSVNGKPPGASDFKTFRKATAANPVPGYHRLAALLAAASDISIDSDGRQVLKIPVLPAGSVRTDTADISSHLSGEAVITITDGKPWVARLKVRARENFKLNLLIKVTNFEQTYEYRLGPDGKPRLASQSALSKGNLMGIGGGQTDEVVYAYR
ncbi:hypothetical protein [Sandarakinorhabdus sp.]|uniref:hypothetical protein n=1 Tax=Sandarakinorhabdus sp. TaxID=1916663 RepID=UPI00333E5557